MKEREVYAKMAPEAIAKHYITWLKIRRTDNYEIKEKEERLKKERLIGFFVGKKFFLIAGYPLDMDDTARLLKDSHYEKGGEWVAYNLSKGKDVYRVSVFNK